MINPPGPAGVPSTAAAAGFCYKVFLAIAVAYYPLLTFAQIKNCEPKNILTN